jgi:hypothetical protein
MGLRSRIRQPSKIAHHLTFGLTTTQLTIGLFFCFSFPQVLSNLANFKTFGFTKFVPRVPQEKFAAVVESSYNAANAVPLWNEVR